MTSQFLFGETFQILSFHKTWVKTKGALDGYEGWVDLNQFLEVPEQEYNKLTAQKQSIALDLAKAATNETSHLPLLIGSTLPHYDGLNFFINKQKYVYSGQVLQPDHHAETHKLLPKVASKFLNAPYLWGGKSAFGIDCSGFTQVVYKILGISIQRDAYQQATEGAPVHLISEAMSGDLAFFTNHKGSISHVGIILPDQKIIHASGLVKVNKIDNQGIFNEQKGRYTHNLRLIRRYF